jgi:DNA topoisomerase-1
MAKNLVIVESPAKAKTIEKYLGSDYHVLSSYGHIRDLPKKGMSIDIEHGFAPTYAVNDDKKKTVNALKAAAKTAETIWLASDDDREGEAIAWHLTQALNLPAAKTKRIVFHEITKSAIEDAIKKPRQVDQPLVDAQQARRVLDRIVGYELSPVLWKKVQGGLSAGRVQSVAVRLIVEREREIENFTTNSQFKVTAEFPLAEGRTLKAELPKKFATADEARKFLASVSGADFSVANLETKPGKRTPAAPFYTSTLQQEAARKLGFSVRQTMSVAQKLYEAGHITYMRTDSLNLSETALSGAAKAITKLYGKEFASRRTFKTKSAGAQEAHEAIRPTDFGASTLPGDRNQQRLYELIWKRAIASQMAEAQMEKTEATVAISTVPETLRAKGEVVKFEGFLAVYLESKDEDEEETGDVLPPLKVGEKLNLDHMTAAEVYDKPKPRYTEASLVRQLEEMGIGRPSTYAPTISTIQDRGYVEKADIEGKEREVLRIELGKDGKTSERKETEGYGADRAKLLPTTVGVIVTDFLVKYFAAIVDYDFTAKVEQEFDDIADGKQKWNAMISEWYGPFHATVTDADGIPRSEAAQARVLGNDPKSGKPISARLGRYGPMLQMGEATDDEKPKFAPIPQGTRMEDVTFEQALELFKLPRVLGKTEEGEEILTNYGPFGPFVKFGKLYVSIKPDDPFSITLERARELIKEKEATEAAKNIQEFPKSSVKVLNGRYGAYITDGKKNAKIPMDQDPAKLTLAECEELLAAAPIRAKRPKRQR